MPGGVAVCSLAGLAFMCSGSPPGQGPFGKNIDRCVKFITHLRAGERLHLACPASARTTCTATASPRCSCPRSTACRTARDIDATVGDKLRTAVKLTCQCQNDAGGWRYQPQKSDADLSITICQIMGLRAARDAGIHVPDEVRDKCIDYVKKSQNADGGFRYQISSGGGSTFPLTAAGVVSLYSAGIYDGEQVEKGLKWLMKYLPGKGSSNTGYFFYGHYYAVQAMWHAGGELLAASGIPRSATRCSPGKPATARWPTAEVCPEFGTAMACIILQMPNNYLPIFSP